MLTERNEAGVMKGVREFLSDLMHAAEVRRELDMLLARNGYQVIKRGNLGTGQWQVLTPVGWHEVMFNTPGEAYRFAMVEVFGERQTRPFHPQTPPPSPPHPLTPSPKIREDG